MFVKRCFQQPFPGVSSLCPCLNPACSVSFLIRHFEFEILGLQLLLTLYFLFYKFSSLDFHLCDYQPKFTNMVTPLLIYECPPPPTFTGSPQAHEVSWEMSRGWGPMRGLPLTSTLSVLIHLLCTRLYTKWMLSPKPSLDCLPWTSLGGSLATYYLMCQTLLTTPPPSPWPWGPKELTNVDQSGQTFKVTKQNR